jgi:single-stranded DNA-binding protein
LEGAAGARQGQGPRLGLNRLYLSGVLAAEPQRDKGRDGEAVMLLLIAFPAPDASDRTQRPETASCEVEVPGWVAEGRGTELRAGEAIFITGQLSGGGGIIATEIHSGPPPQPVA